MKTPYLRRQEEVKTAHGYTWSDYYSWIHQSNCLEILQDKSKLNKYQWDIVHHHLNIGNRPFGSASWTVVEANCHFTK